MEWMTLHGDSFAGCIWERRNVQSLRWDAAGLWERQHEGAALSLRPHSLADAAARAAPAVVHVGVGSPNGHAANVSLSGSRCMPTSVMT